MPVRRTEQRKDRRTPYKVLKKAPMAAVLSPRPPMHAWPSLDHQAAPQNWQPHLQHYHHRPPASNYPQPGAVPSSVVIPVPSSSSAAGHHVQTRRHSPSHGAVTAENPWTSEMDAILIDAQARGLRWEQISQDYFPHKSANACRKRFGRAKEERRVSDWDEQRVAFIILAYNQDGMREKMWSHIAHETGEKWQDLERWCFSQGLLKMTKGRNGHTRRRSTASRHSLTMARNTSRYESVSNDEFEGSDESGIGIGLRANQAYHSSSTSHVALAPIPASAGPMLHAPHQYAYGP